MSREKSKILILIPRMGGGGAERVVSIIANNLCEDYNIQITTLVSKESFFPLDSRVSLKSACFSINRRNKIMRYISMGVNFISAILFIRKSIKEYQPNIVFSVLEEMDIVVYIATHGLKGFKIINSERNDPFNRNRIIQKILEKIYKNTDMLVCQSQTVANYYYRVHNKVVIPNPVDFNIYPKRVPEGINTRVVSVGRLQEQKNFLMLEKAFAKIAMQFPDVNVTVYGEGPQRKMLEEAVKKDHLDNRFLFPGSSKDVLNKIKDAAVFAFPTNYEGFPNALIEAISLGIPVVTTDFATGIAREIVKENVGIVVPVGDKVAFAEGLKELLSNKDKRLKIREEAPKAIEPFAKNIILGMWLGLFQKLLKR